MNNIVNQVAFLRTSREFPEDLHQLAVESNKSYVDVANAVNARTIGIFPVNQAAITGNSYFITNQRQQTLRQVFTFTSTTAITHGINGTAGITPSQFVHCYGNYTNGTNGFGLIWGTSGGPIPNQISFYLTSTQIIFIVDAGAPALTSGRIVLEWLSAI